MYNGVESRGQIKGGWGVAPIKLVLMLCGLEITHSLNILKYLLPEQCLDLL